MTKSPARGTQSPLHTLRLERTKGRRIPLTTGEVQALRKQINDSDEVICKQGGIIEKLLMAKKEDREEILQLRAALEKLCQENECRKSIISTLEINNDEIKRRLQDILSMAQQGGQRDLRRSEMDFVFNPVVRVLDGVKMDENQVRFVLERGGSFNGSIPLESFGRLMEGRSISIFIEQGRTRVDIV
jgi:hypothetical protein